MPALLERRPRPATARRPGPPPRPRTPWVDPTTVRYTPESLRSVGRCPGEHFRRMVDRAREVGPRRDVGPRRMTGRYRPAADPVADFPLVMAGDDYLVYLAQGVAADGSVVPCLAEQRVRWLFPSEPGLFASLYRKVTAGVERLEGEDRAVSSADAEAVRLLGSQAYAEAMAGLVRAVLAFEPDKVGPSGRAGDSPEVLGRYVWYAVFGETGRLRSTARVPGVQFHAKAGPPPAGRPEEETEDARRRGGNVPGRFTDEADADGRLDEHFHLAD